MTQPSQLPWGSCLATLPNAQGILDFTPDMQVATGRDVLSQSLVRRLSTPRGSVITSPNDCIDLRSYLAQGMSTASLQALCTVVRNEVLRDQRVLAVTVNATFNPLSNALTIVLSIQSSYGPFTLTLTLTASSIGAIVSGQ